MISCQMAVPATSQYRRCFNRPFYRHANIDAKCYQYTRSRYLHLQSCNWCFNFWSGTRFHIWSYTDQLHTDRNTNRFDRWSTGDHQLRWNASDCKRWQLFRKCSRYQCQPQHSCQRYVVRWKSGHSYQCYHRIDWPCYRFCNVNTKCCDHSWPGVYTYNPATGVLTFDPNPGFTTDPTPINYILTETLTGLSDQALVTITYNEVLRWPMTTKAQATFQAIMQR